MAFCWAKANIVPNSSTGSLKSLNFTAAFISSRSVTVPWVASRSPCRMSPRPSRSKAMRMPSPCLASSMPCCTMPYISEPSRTTASLALVIRLPPNTANAPSILLPIPLRNPPPADDFPFSSAVTSARSALAALMRVFRLSRLAARFLPKVLLRSSSVMFLYMTFRLTKASESSLIFPRADVLVVCIEPRALAKSFASRLA